MERVAFLIEETNQRLGCLLNPESLLLRRVAGVQPRRAATGWLTGTGLQDDPLLYTGGGRTELELNLLFDVSLAGSSIASADVRDLTGPLWQLAENAAGDYGRPPVVRFIWGKSWNVPGIVVAVAERLEYFTAAGVPQRSWLRLRLVRVSESLSANIPPQRSSLLSTSLPLGEEGTPVEEVTLESNSFVHENIWGERLDQLAFRYYGDAALWRLLAIFNGIDDPLRLPAGRLLQIPPASAGGTLWSR